MSQSDHILGKFLYALLFLIAIPAGLWFWAKSTEQLIKYPALQSDLIGWIFTGIGLCLMLWGMYSLKKYGKGLPMNSYPPRYFVTQGPFKIFHHPIYWGFGILVFGVSLITGSASGFWLVAPFTILVMVALVLGYEKIYLEHHFQDAVLHSFFDLPEKSSEKPSIKQKLAGSLRILVLLVICNLILWSVERSELQLMENISDSKRIIDFPGVFAVSFSIIFLAPFLIKTKEELRKWILSSTLGLGFLIYLGLIFPVFRNYLPQKSGLDETFQTLSNVFFVPVFLIGLSLKSVIKKSQTKLFVLSILIAIILSLIQLSFSKSLFAHLATSLIIFGFASSHFTIWYFLKDTAEKIANSWQEWIFGKVRVINHGFYIGIGTFMGIFLAGYLSGKIYSWAILVFAVVVIIFSALWAQIIEGSNKLKRPFGYYGALVGIPFASFIVWKMGTDVWVIIGVISVVMPWVQAIGRLRCLVNGCCHGSPVEDINIGIRYFHDRSRVCTISGLKGKLLHPTQLYSIIWLTLIGFIMLALWKNSNNPSFIFGLYLILTGLGRFVEEAYRGESQTPFVKGLRLYQWTAIISVVIGIIMTTIPTNPITASPGVGWEIVLSATLGGLFACFAMGVDFPYSNKRFSRLV